MQALRAAIPVEESFLELAGGGPAARVDFAACLQPGLRETDRHPAEQAQGKGRLGVVDPAVIFPQRDVQSVMQTALDHPVAPLEFEKAARIQFFQGETADEINDFGGLFTLASNPAPQSGDALNSGKAHLLGAGIPAIQHSDFASAPVALAGHDVGVRGGLRGKTLFGEPRLQRFEKTLLVLFDRPQVLPALRLNQAQRR